MWSANGPTWMTLADGLGTAAIGTLMAMRMTCLDPDAAGRRCVVVELNRSSAMPQCAPAPRAPQHQRYPHIAEMPGRFHAAQLPAT
jgi:hypothetical protein